MGTYDVASMVHGGLMPADAPFPTSPLNHRQAIFDVLSNWKPNFSTIDPGQPTIVELYLPPPGKIGISSLFLPTSENQCLHLP